MTTGPATMPPMGRRRKDTASGLEPRVYMRAGSYYYVHRGTGKWEPLGKDLAKANERARHYNDPAGLHGTLVYWLDEFLVHCEARVKAGSMAQRTLDDYTLAIKGIPPKGDKPGRPGALRVFFAPPLAPTQVTPAMVQDFLEANAELGRPVPANREKAALSAAMSWMISKARVPGLVINPCLRASGVKRNAEPKRDVYVSHQDYQDVYAVAHNSVRLMMELTYRTLQRPESDIINWDNSVLGTVDGKRVLKFKQAKTYARTGKTMQIEVPAELAELIRQSLGEVPKLRQPLVRTRDGHAYTYDGLSAMLKRSIAKVNKARKAKGLEPVQSFGFRDLKGKGATDMWLTGEPMEKIQLLCGHEDKTTTEIYVKQRWRETVQPNRVAM